MKSTKVSSQNKGPATKPVITFVTRFKGSAAPHKAEFTEPGKGVNYTYHSKRPTMGVNETRLDETQIIVTFTNWQAKRHMGQIQMQLEALLKSTAQLYIDEGFELAQKKQRALVDIFASDVPAPRYNMREAKMIARAQEKVISATEWVNAAELSDLAGMTSSNKSSGPTKWKKDLKIFSVNYKSEELYPIYALDKNNGFKPLKGMKPILELFEGRKDSWGAAYWFAGINGYLGGKRPQDIVASDPESVLKAAKDEVAGVTHG